MAKIASRSLKIYIGKYVASNIQKAGNGVFKASYSIYLNTKSQRDIFGWKPCSG